MEADARNVFKAADKVCELVAQERLGHSTINTTLDLYSHVTETMQEDAAAELDKAFRVAMRGSGITK